MDSVNNFNATGNVATDPELRAVSSGLSILTFRVAINNSKKVGDEWHDVPLFLTCKAFGKRAEGISKIIRKGSFVAIAGKLWPNEWEKDGEKRKEVECHLETCIVKNIEARTEPRPAFDEDVPF